MSQGVSRIPQRCDQGWPGSVPKGYPEGVPRGVQEMSQGVSKRYSKGCPEGVPKGVQEVFQGVSRTPQGVSKSWSEAQRFPQALEGLLNALENAYGFTKCKKCLSKSFGRRSEVQWGNARPLQPSEGLQKTPLITPRTQVSFARSFSYATAMIFGSGGYQEHLFKRYGMWRRTIALLIVLQQNHLIFKAESAEIADIRSVDNWNHR